MCFLGKVKDNIANLIEADILVINAGFVATSEASVINKPVLIIPVPNHAEQYINARLLLEAKKGFIVDETGVLGKIKELLLEDPSTELDFNHVTVNSDGAFEASAAILSWFKRRN